VASTLINPNILQKQWPTNVTTFINQTQTNIMGSPFKTLIQLYYNIGTLELYTSQHHKINIQFLETLLHMSMLPILKDQVTCTYIMGRALTLDCQKYIYIYIYISICYKFLQMN